MKKIILAICVILTSSIISNIANAKFYGGNARECPILFKITEWEYSERWNNWGKRQDWYESNGWVTNTGIGIYTKIEDNSYTIKNNPTNPATLVYIGPWQKVTLTKGSFFNKEKIETEIRMIASQKGKFLENHFEIKDELNSKIPEQEFVPLEEPQDLIVKCDILRAQKWGYNAVADYHINIFRAYLGKPILGGSGKIIDSETGEVIADEHG